jgi:poly(A) polymerase
MEQERPVFPVVLARPEHPISRRSIDRDALWLMNRLRREGFAAYLVGGAVRDLLLGLEPKDFDVGTDARPSEIRRLFRHSRLIGRRFRLAHVYFRRKGAPEKVVEVSTFRSRRKWQESEGIPAEDLDLTGSGFGPPEEDAWRRDFTVNAILYNLSDFSVVDHVGGLEDLDRGLIRIIGDPDDRFAEDPVRMLRALEFAARLGFRIEEETERGVRRNAHLVTAASPPRLREELRQLQQRGIMAEVLAEAHRLGLFEHLLPEVEEVSGLFSLVELLDERARTGDPPDESRYLTALLLPTVASRCPLVSKVSLEGAHKVIGPAVDRLTRHYQISAHTRHLAKECLLSCYRLARARAYRTKAKFVRRSEFQDAWAFFTLWARVTGEIDEEVEYWRRYLAGERDAGRAKRRRRRRRPKATRTNPADGP